MKSILQFIGLFVIVIFISACDSKQEEATIINDDYTQSTVLSTIVPNFILVTTKGEKIEMEVTRQTIFSHVSEGKLLLVNFWAPWCKPCLNEIPNFVKVQEKYKDDFMIIGVLFDEKTTKKELDAFLIKYNINFTIAVGKENLPFAKAVGNVKMIPESFLYNRDGILVEKFIGEVSESKLQRHIEENMN